MERYFTFKEHFQEFRSRLFKIVAYFIISFSISYYFHRQIFNFFAYPLYNEKHLQMIYTALPEAFLSFVKLSATNAIFCTIPFFVYQILRFIWPALTKYEKKITIFVSVFSLFLFYFACFFSIFLVIPKAWNFFILFEQYDNSHINLVLNAKISEYISLITQIIFGFGLAFQLPIVIVILVMLDVVKIEKLISYRRFAIICIFIISAILTPPDIISQIILALPLILLYEMSIKFCKFFNQGKQND